MSFEVAETTGTISLAVVNQTNPGCDEEELGSITLVAEGGEPEYVYSINNQSAVVEANVISGLSAGMYQVTVVDASGCSASIDVELVAEGGFDGITSIGPITGTSTTICPDINAVEAYSIAPVDIPNTNITWSYSGEGATISPAMGTNGVDVTYSGEATPGFLFVEVSGACGSLRDSLEIVIADPAICSGVSCIDTVIVNEALLFNDSHSDIFRAEEVLISNGVITSLNNEEITFQAGTCINLLPGFEVEEGAILEAFIQGCVPVPNLSAQEYRKLEKSLLRIVRSKEDND